MFRAAHGSPTAVAIVLKGSGLVLLAMMGTKAYQLMGGGKASETAPVQGFLGLTLAIAIWSIACFAVKFARGFHEAMVLVAVLWLICYFLLWARSVFILFGFSDGPALKPWQAIGKQIDWVDRLRSVMLTFMMLAPLCAVLYSMPQFYYAF